ncbi:hypothetical protein D9757_013687 [Collybiopsis confluens]|uniref:Uncharacterized protein n=1 Tax=Collybiopsis confluens TaxID=2823264 RepID=A0A8H5FNE7_9AGAR|nr:hypothetical protein D9757_013687 [Collybiopsis confluens]
MRLSSIKTRASSTSFLPSFLLFPTTATTTTSHVCNVTRVRFTTSAPVPAKLRVKQLQISPLTPTALQGQQKLELCDGNDLLLQYPRSSLHVLPGRVDVGRFSLALSRTLALFPTAAGKLRRNGDDWHIELSNSSVPLTIEGPSSESESSSSSPTTTTTFPIPPSRAHFVVQPDEYITPFIDPIDYVGSMQGKESSLISLKLTELSDGKTVFGLSFNHVLGDGNTVTRFTHMLSTLYASEEQQILDLESLPSSCPPAPTFYKRKHEPLPSPFDPEGLALVRKYAPQVEKSFPLEQVLEKFQKDNQETEVVEMLFSEEEIDALWTLARQVPNKDAAAASLKITKNDALSAYLVTLFERALGERQHTVMTILNLRHQSPPTEEKDLWLHPTVAGCPTAIVHTSIGHLNAAPQNHDDFAQVLHDIAIELRKTNKAARDPHFVSQYLRVVSAQYIKGCNDSRFYVYPDEGGILINSIMREDRNKLAHFGFEGRTQFYTDTSVHRIPRIHPANPVIIASETSTSQAWNDHSGAVVVNYRIRRDAKEITTDTKERDMRMLTGSIKH